MFTSSLASQLLLLELAFAAPRPSALAWQSMYSFDESDYVKKPITSRAHLLDIAAYISRHSLPPLSYLDCSTPISVSMLQGCADEAGIEFQPGDILLVRIGWTEAFEGLPQKARDEIPYREVRGFGGVDANEESMRWHWDKGIAAVVTDGYVFVDPCFSPLSLSLALVQDPPLLTDHGL